MTPTSASVIKLWRMLDWTGRNTPTDTLGANQIIGVLDLYGMKFPEIWEWILMIEQRIFKHRQGLIEQRKKAEEMRQKRQRG